MYVLLIVSQTQKVQDAIIIALANSGISFLAGFAVFSVLGYLAHSVGGTLDDLGVGGLSLAFVTYPVKYSPTVITATPHWRQNNLKI